MTSVVACLLSKTLYHFLENILSCNVFGDRIQCSFSALFCSLSVLQS